MNHIVPGARVKIKDSVPNTIKVYAGKVAKVLSVSGAPADLKIRLDIDHGSHYFRSDHITVIQSVCLPVNDKDLDFWIDSKLNVLMVGLHGIGKTAKITEAFNRHGLNWKYFSASTMDPWVDFVGIPRAQTDENGNEYLDLLRSKDFDEVEALFFDEFNRAKSKVVNAVMELIQFKSINGHRFKKLQFIWAAINPDDDEDLEFSVESLDPAQKDRFQIKVVLPYEPNSEYFAKKYGETVSKQAIAWWNSLSYDTQLSVSPRRLDYALDVYKRGGNVRFVLPAEANVSEFLKAMDESKNHGEYAALVKTYRDNNPDAAKKLLKNSKTYSALVTYAIHPAFAMAVENNANLKQETSITEFALPLLTDEQVTSLMFSYDRLARLVFEMYRNKGLFQDVIGSLEQAGQFTQEIASAREMKKIIDNSNVKTDGVEAVILDALNKLGKVGIKDILEFLSKSYGDVYNVNNVRGALGSLNDKKLVTKHGTRGRGVKYEPKK